MKKTKVKYVKAKNLKQDDWFKLAGQLYRVADVEDNLYNDSIVRFFNGSLKNHEFIEIHTLIVPKTTIFKIYRLK